MTTETADGGSNNSSSNGLAGGVDPAAGGLQTAEARDEVIFLETLTQNFLGDANNGSLRAALNWDSERYWAVRNRLIDKGKVQKAHGGPGGKTILVTPAENLLGEPLTGQGGARPYEPVAADAASSQQYPNEAALYEPIRQQIDTAWTKDEGYYSWLIRRTAELGRRITGGRWTRPDIALVAVQKFKFLRDPVYDVVSFEVKPRDQITVEGMFEALAHRQYTTRAYVVFHASREEFETEREAGRIIALSEQHGVGLMLAKDPSNYETWIERVRGRRWSPDPQEMNDFIQRIFPQSDHDEIIKLLK
jgi:hypothetical protein